MNLPISLWALHERNLSFFLFPFIRTCTKEKHARVLRLYTNSVGIPIHSTVVLIKLYSSHKHESGPYSINLHGLVTDCDGRFAKAPREYTALFGRCQLCRSSLFPPRTGPK